ncbi:MAG TPA: hypothetical protein VK783_00850 [Bacteroidia bacterium]|jgi:hypothetical protein|nr:hypothetical protein [Bacteroidia bacterium]
MERHRLINDNDIIKYLQENQALLKTILWRQQQASTNPAQAEIENLAKYREFLANAEFVLNENTKIKEQ